MNNVGYARPTLGRMVGMYLFQTKDIIIRALWCALAARFATPHVTLKGEEL